MNDQQIAHRFTILTWAVGVTAALTIATLSIVVTMSFQLGQITGELAVLLNHVELK